MKIAIVTDTNSGFSKFEAEKLGIFIVPMPVIINSETYFENENITMDKFITYLESGQDISTSQPSPGDIMDLWNNILSSGDYDQILYIPMSSGLSKSCETATVLSGDYENKVYVVDNKRVSVTLKESVLQADMLAKNGHSASEIKDILEKDSLNSVIYIMLNTLEYLKKGGRITPAVAMLGSVLKIKPILSIQGDKLDSFAKARNINKGKNIMLETVKNDLTNRFASNDMSRLKIALAGSLSDAEQINSIKEFFQNEFPECEIYYDPLPISLTCHIGPEAFGIGVCFR